MARLLRLTLPDYTQHLGCRGNNRQATFFAEDDYRFYLKALKDAADASQCAIHAYALMTNHVHLLVTAHTYNGLSRCMQVLGRRYVRYVNYGYRRSGTLWEGRYRSTVIDSDRYLLTCYRYLERNPVRANRVAHPSDYPWTSYHHHVF
jgi:putative transposase